MEKRRYEAPEARSLSGLDASGQGPLYLCNAGAIATPEGCTDGFAPEPVGTCSNGITFGGDAPCTAGSTPDSGECITGGSPTAGGQCLSGVSFV
jgi:hypothetical protein